MPTLDNAIELINDYSDSYRNPNMEPFVISKRYALFPSDKEIRNSKYHWPNEYPNASRQGIYLICGTNLDLLYVGKVSMNNSFGSRFSAYFAYEADGKTCKLKHGDNWSQKPYYLLTVAVPRDSSFEAPALEEYLIKSFGETLPDNKIGTTR